MTYIKAVVFTASMCAASRSDAHIESLIHIELSTNTAGVNSRPVNVDFSTCLDIGGLTQLGLGPEGARDFFAWTGFMSVLVPAPAAPLTLTACVFACHSHRSNQALTLTERNSDAPPSLGRSELCLGYVSSEDRYTRME
ncbi:MAG: hypothetical protein AAGB51_03600 [Planctomycetota bacterium]